MRGVRRAAPDAEDEQAAAPLPHLDQQIDGSLDGFRVQPVDDRADFIEVSCRERHPCKLEGIFAASTILGRGICPCIPVALGAESVLLQPLQPPRARPPVARPPWLPEALRAGCLSLLCALVFCHVYNRFDLQTWRTPIEYGDADTADAKAILAATKAASEGHIWPLLQKRIPELGAPNEANWSDFPSGDETLICAGGLLARVVGLFPAVNLMTLLAHILAASAFYFACRAMRCDWVWSFAGALVFAFTRYSFAHGEHHLALIYYWHLPLCLLVCRWISTGSGLRFSTRRYLFALAVAVAAGAQNVYYANLFIQLAALGAFFRLLRNGWKPALPAATVAAAAVFTFLLLRTDTFYYRHLYGPNPDAIERSYGWLEYFGLKISDFFVPPPDHRIPFFAGFGQNYFTEVVLKGETPPACYFGLAGIASLAWLVVVSARRVLKNPSRGLPLEAWQILWILFYAMVGGLNAIIGSLGFLLFRSTTRYCIFIEAIVLLFAARRLSAWSRKTPRPGIFAAAAVCAAAVAVWDQSPPQLAKDKIAETEARVSSDRTFTAKMEGRLPAGAMVFQMPVMDFPESPVDGVAAYDHFRPYLYSKRLCYVFGSVQGRDWDDWQEDVEDMTISEAVPALEKMGFAAVYVNRDGYADKGAKLLGEFRAAGRGDIIESPMGDLFCVFLKR